jgi:hypothetical protein
MPNNVFGHFLEQKFLSFHVGTDVRARPCTKFLKEHFFWFFSGVQAERKNIDVNLKFCAEEERLNLFVGFLCTYTYTQCHSI